MWQSKNLQFAELGNFRSAYPLILSIENHCSVEQQDKMAEYMVSMYLQLYAL